MDVCREPRGAGTAQGLRKVKKWRQRKAAELAGSPGAAESGEQAASGASGGTRAGRVFPVVMPSLFHRCPGIGLRWPRDAVT